VGGEKPQIGRGRKRESLSPSLASFIAASQASPKMSRPLTANSRNEAEMMSKAKRQQTMAQDPLGMQSLSFQCKSSLDFFFFLNHSSSLI
jgi:hypothetical protein